MAKKIDDNDPKMNLMLLLASLLLCAFVWMNVKISKKIEQRKAEQSQIDGRTNSNN